MRQERSDAEILRDKLEKELNRPLNVRIGSDSHPGIGPTTYVIVTFPTLPDTRITEEDHKRMDEKEKEQLKEDKENFYREQKHQENQALSKIKTVLTSREKLPNSNTTFNERFPDEGTFNKFESTTTQQKEYAIKVE